MPSKKITPGHVVNPTKLLLLENFLFLNYSELVQKRVSCKKVVKKSLFCPKVTTYFVRPDDMTA